MPPVVLQNTRHVDNPWFASWLDGVRAAGLTSGTLSWATLLRAHGSGDWVQLQWPEAAISAPAAWRSALGGAKLLVMVLLARLKRVRVLLTAHNVRSHDQRHPHVERVFWPVLCRLVTDVHLLSAASRDDLLEAHPGLGRATFHVIPHGDYNRTLGRLPVNRDRAREALGLEVPRHARVALLVGAVRAYKGFREFAREAGATPDGWCVVLAGSTNDAAVVNELTGSTHDSLVLRLRYHSDEEISLLLAACDVVVLPYLSVLNSGSALLALSAGRPVYAPRTETFLELAEQVGGGWVQLFAPTPTPRDLAAFREPSTDAPDLTDHAWARIHDSQRILFTGQ